MSPRSTARSLVAADAPQASVAADAATTPQALALPVTALRRHPWLVHALAPAERATRTIPSQVLGWGANGVALGAGDRVLKVSTHRFEADLVERVITERVRGRVLHGFPGYYPPGVVVLDPDDLGDAPAGVPVLRVACWTLDRVTPLRPSDLDTGRARRGDLVQLVDAAAVAWRHATTAAARAARDANWTQGVAAMARDPVLGHLGRSLAALATPTERVVDFAANLGLTVDQRVVAFDAMLATAVPL